MPRHAGAGGHLLYNLIAPVFVSGLPIRFLRRSCSPGFCAGPSVMGYKCEGTNFKTDSPQSVVLDVQMSLARIVSTCSNVCISDEKSRPNGRHKDARAAPARKEKIAGHCCQPTKEK